MMDDIGEALLHGWRMFLHEKRRTGRTERLVHMVQDGDFIVCGMRSASEDLKRRLRQQNIDAVVSYIDPRYLDKVHEHISMGTGGRRHRVLFDHTFYEGYYQYAIERSIETISGFEGYWREAFERSKPSKMHNSKVWHDAAEAAGLT